MSDGLIYCTFDKPFLWYTEAAHDANGIMGVMLEINNKQELGKNTISRNLFRRICKRNDIDTSTAYEILASIGWFVDSRWRIFPIELRRKRWSWYTYQGWKDKGFIVRPNAICFAVGLDDRRKYYNNDQVGEI